MRINLSQEEAAFAALTDERVEEIAAFGAQRPMSAGEYLFRAGEDADCLCVVLSGAIEVIQPNGDTPVLIASYGPGSFAGELNLLTGQRRYLSCRVTESGQVLVVGVPQFRRLATDRHHRSDSRLTPAALLMPTRWPSALRSA